MTRLIRVVCPVCRGAQEIGPDQLGREQACGQCQARFTPTTAEGTGTGEKVLVECPGCHRPLKVRTEYLGKTLTCKHCDRAFVARMPDPSSPATLAEVVPEEKVRPWVVPPDRGPAIEALESRLGAIEDRLDSLHRQATGRGEEVADLAAAIEAERSARGTEVDAVRTELVRLEESSRTREDAGRDALGASLGEIRDSIRGEVAAIGDRQAERDRRADRLDLRLDELESRLGALDASTARRDEWRGQLDASAESARRDRDRELGTLRAEAEATRAELAGRIEQADGRAEAGRDALDRALREAREEIGALGDRHRDLGQAVEARAGWDGQLAALKEEVAAIRLDSERRREHARDGEAAVQALRDALERHRAEQAEALREARERGETLEAELARLRDELARKPEPAPAPAPALVPTASPPPVVRAPAPRSAPAGPPASTGPRAPIDLQALDLAFDLLDAREEAPAPAGLPEAPDPRVEYDRMAARYAGMMRERTPAELIPDASRLAEFTRAHFGQESNEHALALRNLAILLPSQGESARAEALLDRAREVCRRLHGIDHPSYGICQLDLAELSLIRGDLARAKALGEEALAIFIRAAGPDGELAARARYCLAQIEARRPANPGLATVSFTI